MALLAAPAAASPTVQSVYCDDADIENGVAHTARWTAAMRTIEHERPDALFSDPLARVFAGGIAYEKWKVEMAALNADQPHARSHIAIRARALDDIVVDEMELLLPADSLQVVSLGAGMCTRPWRLKAPEQTPVVWLEVDRPDSMRLKAATARTVGIKPNVSTYQNIGVDFSDPNASLTNSLEANKFDPQAPTIFILEGLLPYLTYEDVDALALEINDMVDVQSELCLVMTVINDGFYQELRNPNHKTVEKYPGTQEVGTLFHSSWEGGIQSSFQRAGFSLTSIISREEYATKHLGVEMINYTFPDRTKSTEWIIVMKRRSSDSACKPDCAIS